MAFVLSDYEAGPRHQGDAAAQLAALHRRLAQIQIAYIVHRRRAIVVLEGWDASGKGGIVQRLVAGWDPRHVAVHAIQPPSSEERALHPMARFWAKLPAMGRIHVFDRSWYGRVLGDRVDGLVDRAQWRRAYDEINEFEAQQKDAGTTLVKLFLHVTQDEQTRRLKARLAHRWKRWKVTEASLHHLGRRAEHRAAAEEMLAKTDTRWAPWTVIDANQKKHARLAALTRIAELLEKGLDLRPPMPDPAVAAWAAANWDLTLD